MIQIKIYNYLKNKTNVFILTVLFLFLNTFFTSAQTDTTIAPKPTVDTTKITDLSKTLSDSLKKQTPSSQKMLDATFLYGEIELKKGDIISNVIKIVNNDKKVYSFSLELSHPYDWRSITKTDSIYKMNPGDTLYVPVRIIPTSVIKGNTKFLINAFLLAEVYNPKEARNYINLGKMDYLYDKVLFYDKLKDIIKGKSLPDGISDIQKDNADIEHHMFHFLDNHDEQRLASPEFAGTPEKGKPLMVVSTTISTSPTMIYFGQEVGEAGNENGGFGTHSRTSIFDYVGVPNHQRWMNEGKFDGGQLSESEKDLRDFYKRLLNFSLKSSALMGKYQEIQTINRSESLGYDPGIYSFVRWSNTQKLIIVTNFSWVSTSSFELKIPSDIIKSWKLKDGIYSIKDQLNESNTSQLHVVNGVGNVKISIEPSESFIFQL